MQRSKAYELHKLIYKINDKAVCKCPCVLVYSVA